MFVLINFSHAQDIITLKSGEELSVTILRLNPEKVLYFAENSTDTTVLPRTDVVKLKYKSGTIIYLSEEKSAMDFSKIDTTMYDRGVRDAERYYKGYKAAGTGTLVTSLFIPLGLIPAIACSSTEPSMKNLGYRDQNLMNDPGYYLGYTDKAYSIKKKKVWKNFAIGTGITAAYYFLLIGIGLGMY